MTIEAKVAAKISDYELAFTAGSDAGVKTDDIATVYAMIEVKDPDSRDVIGVVRRPAIRMRVTEVQERMCVARSIEPAESAVGADFYPSIAKVLKAATARSVKAVAFDSNVAEEDVVFLKAGWPVVIASPTPREAASAPPRTLT